MTLNSTQPLDVEVQSQCIERKQDLLSFLWPQESELHLHGGGAIVNGCTQVYHLPLLCGQFKLNILHIMYYASDQNFIWPTENIGDAIATNSYIGFSTIVREITKVFKSIVEQHEIIKKGFFLFYTFLMVCIYVTEISPDIYIFKEDHFPIAFISFGK